MQQSTTLRGGSVSNNIKSFFSKKRLSTTGSKRYAASQTTGKFEVYSETERTWKIINPPHDPQSSTRLHATTPASSSSTQALKLKQPVTVDWEKDGLLSTSKITSFPPLNTHGVGKAGKNPPFIGKVVQVKRLGGRDKERDVTHIVIDTGGVVFVEGQSFGVQPPGTKLTSKGEVPQHVRLYSIASSRYGDSRDGTTCTLCVVRVIYQDPKTREEKRGLCSNYLADVKVGDELIMTGPSGTALLLAEDAFDRPVVCVSTGTGIAPFRSFWRRLVYDGLPSDHNGSQYRTYGPRGRFWLLAGFANEDSVLYGDELAAAASADPDHVHVDIALSLQQKNAAGGANYVQDCIEENADEFLKLMNSDDALFYFCGLKRMYSSVLEVLQRVGKDKGMDAVALIAKLKKEHRWHVETA